MTRTILFDPDEKCNICGEQGAYDFIGDYICGKCLYKRQKENNQENKPAKEKMRNCNQEGHKLKEVKATIGYECEFCFKYIRADNIPKAGYGRCPKCDAPQEKLESHFWGSSYIEYNCNNCGDSWRELK